MIPLRDDIQSTTTPVVNYTIIGVCAVVFLMQLGAQGGMLAYEYGMVPVRLTDPETRVMKKEKELVRGPFGEPEVRVTKEPAPAPAVPPILTIVTCVFLHGGWMHFLGNMWFLYIFGDNVEDRFGHGGFLAFYLGCGVAASVAHLLVNPASEVPTIGASGAIAGVMGAYFFLYPRAVVLTLIPIFFFLELIVLPAWVFLGIWFVIQLFKGTVSVGEGVAWWAHIGGFAVGFFLSWALHLAGTLREEAPAVRPATRRIRPSRRW